MAKLQELHTKPFGEVILALSDCVEGGGSTVEAQEPDLPLNNLSDSFCTTSLETLSALDPTLPKRVATKRDLPPARSSSAMRALSTAPLTLMQYSNCYSCKNSGNCSVHKPLSFIPSTANSSDLDVTLPLLKCTTASCLVYSNQPLAKCPTCKMGIMGLNCTLTDSAGFNPKSPMPEPWSLHGDLVYQYPFVARKEDVVRGLDLTWTEPQDSAAAGDSATSSAPSASGVLSKARPVVSASQPMHWCLSCQQLQNKVGDQMGCSSCGIRTSWDITFVSADPLDPKKRVYWPLGSIDKSGSEGYPGGGKHEGGASPYCLLTDGLEAHMELSPLKMMETLKAQGVFTFEDVEIVPVKVGPNEVMCCDSLLTVLHRTEKE